MRALILFAHGSRDPLWHGPVQALQALIQTQHPEWTVRCAYLEWSTPDLSQAVAALAADGVDQVRVLPLFLGVGKHAREDLPQLMHSLQTQFPHIAFECLPPVGEHPRLLQALCDIATD